jgi:threonine dehydrogenase-like Zn-dependent dehydrogenase
MLSVYFEAVPWKIALTQILGRFYKGAIWSRLSPLRVGELSEPVLAGPGWVKVRVRSCGLCGSDMHFIKLDFSPGISVTAIPGMERIFLGHELYGEVMETGKEVEDLKQGDKVTFLGFFPNCRAMGLDPCPPCVEGNYTLCLNPHMGKLPSNRGGGFSEFMVAHRSQWVKLPDDFTEDQVLMTEPIAVAVHAVFKHMPGPGERALIIGAGTVGLNILQVIKALEPEASVTVLARYPAQEEIARRLGADKVIRGGDLYSAVAEQTGGRLFNGMMGSRMILGGYDLVHDTIGSGTTFEDSLRWVRRKGAIVLSGVQMAASKVDLAPIWHQEIQITGINCHGQEDFAGTSRTSFDWAIELIQQGKVATAPFISHRFPLTEFKRAVEVMTQKGREPTFKIVLDMAGRG